MSNSKISALTSATTPLVGTEVLPVVQSSTTKQVSVANLTSGRTVDMAFLNVAGTAAKIVNFNTTTANGGYGTWQTNGTSIWDIGSAKQVFNTGTATDGGFASRAGYYLGLGANGNETLRLTTDGNATFVTAAKGVNFTANTPAAGMTSQLLNWYEEGTWTPIDSSGASLSFTSVTGIYTRVGRLVTCTFGLTFPATVSAAGVTIGGLPFTSLSSGTPNPSGGSITYTGAAVNAAGFATGAGGTTVSLYGASGTALTNATFSGFILRGQFTYTVN